jgi:hypothetical protein
MKNFKVVGFNQTDIGGSGINLYCKSNINGVMQDEMKVIEYFQ